MRIRFTAIILGLLAALALTSACEVPQEEPTPVQGANGAGASAKAKTDGGKDNKEPGDPPIALKATRTTFQPGPLSTGGAYSCVKVTVTNHTTKNLPVNPLYFSITGTDGTKREIDLGADDRQIGTTTLAPKEKAKGTVCAEGKFTPRTVAFTNALFSEAARAQVN